MRVVVEAGKETARPVARGAGERVATREQPSSFLEMLDAEELTTEGGGVG
jgi:hypothetical protein